MGLGAYDWVSESDASVLPERRIGVRGHGGDIERTPRKVDIRLP